MTGTSILVADDNEQMAGIMTRILGGTDTRIIYAGDGEMALEAARRESLDMIILDVNMPGMSGFEVCTELRRDPRTRHVPVIMLTGRAGGTDEMYGLNMGADDYIAKPFDPRRLKARAAALLRRNRVRVDLNPLTLLPGNRAIEVEAEARLREGKRFVFTYVDIRRFKAFNDTWGCSWGDQVILHVAQTLCDVADSPGMKGGFVGHVGGDDFVLMTEEPVDPDAVRAAFRGRMQVLRERLGPAASPLDIDLTVDPVTCEPGKFRDFKELSVAAARAKESGKGGRARMRRR